MFRIYSAYPWSRRCAITSPYEPCAEARNGGAMVAMPTGGVANFVGDGHVRKNLQEVEATFVGLSDVVAPVGRHPDRV
jgi:hypothetical protein